MWLRAQTQDGEARGRQLWEAIATHPNPPLPLNRGGQPFLCPGPRGFPGCGTFSVKAGQSQENQDEMVALSRAEETRGRMDD